MSVLQLTYTKLNDRHACMCAYTHTSVSLKMSITATGGSLSMNHIHTQTILPLIELKNKSEFQLYTNTKN